MKDFHRAIAAYVEDTEPTAGDLDRLRWRLRESMAGEGDLQRLLAELPEPPSGAEHRVKRRLARPAPMRVPWMGLGLAAAAILAALAVLPGDEGPTVLDQSLHSPAVLTALDLGDVQLAWQGTGELRGVPEALIVDWEQGVFRADVVPHRGVELVVATPEARVHVKGTAFEVVRDPLGTTVRVDRGVAGLACTDGLSRDVAAGDGATCVRREVAIAPEASTDGLADAQPVPDGADRDLEAGLSMSNPSAGEAPVVTRSKPVLTTEAMFEPSTETLGDTLAEVLTQADQPADPAIPEGITHVEVVAPAVPGEQGSGQGEGPGERRVRYAVGTVQVTGEATAVWLVSKEHGRFAPGEVPRGRYQVRASFPGKVGVSAGWVEVEAGGYINLECSASSGRCWHQ